MSVKQYCYNSWWRAHPNFKLTVLKDIACNYEGTKFSVVYNIIYWVIRDWKKLHFDVVWTKVPLNCSTSELLTKLYKSSER